MRNKVSLLNKRYGNNWFFVLTDRNLKKYYQKYGEANSKRNIKLKIEKIFKNSKK